MTLNAARSFILSNARALERHRFAALFDDAPVAPVEAALSAYLTPSGAFGHALEPDIRTGNPQPIFQEEALKVIVAHGLSRSLIDGIVSALPDLSNPDGALPFTTPSVADAPHAPWWGADAAQPSNLNPTSGICGLLHKAGHDSNWLDTATAFCWTRIETDGEAEMHGIAAVLAFLGAVPDRDRAEAALSKLRAPLRAATSFDHDQEGYAFGPLDYAPTPDAPARAFYDDGEISAHLDALTAAQADDGGWNFPWPETTPGAAQEWRGIVTLRAVTTLRAFGRI